MTPRKKVEEEVDEDAVLSKSRIPIMVGKVQHYITSDSRQWILGYPYQAKQKDGSYKEELKAVAFYSTLQGMLYGIMEKRMRKAEYASFSDLIREVEQSKKELQGVFDTTIREDFAHVVPSGRSAQLKKDYR